MSEGSVLKKDELPTIGEGDATSPVRDESEVILEKLAKMRNTYIPTLIVRS